MKEQTIDVDGAKLRVTSKGDDGAAPILFLHGGLGTSEDFASFFPHFEDRYCVFVDSRGHGGSTLSGELTYERLAVDAEAVMQALNLQRPAIVGYSDGGIAALRIAAAKRVDVGSLILFGTDPDQPSEELVENIFSKLTPETWKQKFPDGVALYERLNPDADFGRLFAAVMSMWQDKTQKGYPGYLIESVRCPTLVIHGDRDHLVSRDATFRLTQGIKQAELGIIPFVGHAVLQERSDLVVSFIREFFARESEARQA